VRLLVAPRRRPRASPGAVGTVSALPARKHNRRSLKRRARQQTNRIRTGRCSCRFGGALSLCAASLTSSAPTGRRPPLIRTVRRPIWHAIIMFGSTPVQLALEQSFCWRPPDVLARRRSSAHPVAWRAPSPSRGRARPLVSSLGVPGRRRRRKRRLACAAAAGRRRRVLLARLHRFDELAGRLSFGSRCAWHVSISNRVGLFKSERATRIGLSGGDV
jgi:hypothetical protein